MRAADAIAALDARLRAVEAALAASEAQGRALAAALVEAGQRGGNADLHQGRVEAVTLGTVNRVRVSVGGGEVPGVACLASYVPSDYDPVWLLSAGGGRWLCLGTV